MFGMDDFPFINRARELEELDAHARAGGLLVVFGRRRVGKTRLLTHWLGSREGLYSQAIEASKEQQVEQIFADVSGRLAVAAPAPRTFLELLQVIDLQPRPVIFCLDELPYLVAADPALPSVLQRWLDHRRHRRTALVVCGSSTRMMNDLFLNRGAPLFGRARKLLAIEPMGYGAFCRACRQNPVAPDSFVRFSLVGGVPRYWELVGPRESPVALAETLFFGRSPFLEFEPSRLLKDEGVAGLTAPAVLEAIGRGAERPSEIAARLGSVQTNLSRLLQILVDARLVERQLPYGESVRTTKRILYRLADPTLRFWFRVFSPHRTRWVGYGRAVKEKLLRDHAATVFEDCQRARWTDAARYWEAAIELDLVRREEDRLVVAEVKWASLTRAERTARERALAERFALTRLARAHPSARFELLDASALLALAKG